MEVITYEIQQQVKVRKYNVDCKKLCNLLRTHKKLTGLNNKRIAELLNVSITKVEHWFRKDKCFSIPDEDVWLSLKQILNIATNDFDLAITTFEEKDNVFEKGNRIYDSKGIAPTITCGDAGLTILERIDTMEVKIIGQMDNTIDHTFESANRVYDKNGLSPTINCCGGGGLQPKIIDDTYANREPRVYEDYSPALRSEREGLKIVEEVIKEYNETAKHQQDLVQYEGDICRCIPAGTHGSTPHLLKTIVAMRGRNPENPSDRTVGAPTEQRLEPNSQGICNTLTSVQKDNLVMEKMCISTKGKENEVASTILAGYERTNMTGFNADNGVIETVRIKQATSQGYIECEVGGVADLSFPDSKTRRGRVQENGQVSPTLMAGEQDICRIEPLLVGGIGEKWGDKQYRQGNRVYDSENVAMAVTSQPLGNMGGNSYMYLTREPQYRIRKLTPKECWRLMDFTDEDFEKAAQVNSNTQLYKQAGNSIVKNVLVAILGQMIPGKEDVYKKLETR